MQTTSSIKEQCSFRTFTQPLPSRVKKSNIAVSSRSAKLLLFQNYVLQSEVEAAESLRTLSRLHEISPRVAANFEPKTNIADDFDFRLYRNDGRTDMPEPVSFVALSYRWASVNSAEESPERAPETDEDFPLPVSRAMFQAVLLELENEDEGLWCDQICIDQGNAHEKQIAIGAMDLVFKSARAVIIVLDDIELDQTDVACLKAYIYEASDESEFFALSPRRPPYLLQNEALRYTAFKILSSSYFTRAWCLHELSLGKSHVFLVRCNISEHIASGYVRFTRQFFHNILALMLDLYTVFAEPFKGHPTRLIGPIFYILTPSYRENSRKRKKIEEARIKAM